MDCKRALQDTGGDITKAVELLRQQGIARAASRVHRVVRQGLVESYIHTGGRVGAMIEVNCESDFVARTVEFKELAHSLAMQVAAMAPRYIDAEDLPQEDGSKPEELCLLTQPFIRDPARTVRDVVNEAVAKVGENIRVSRFVRFALGE